MLTEVEFLTKICHHTVFRYSSLTHTLLLPLQKLDGSHVSILVTTKMGGLW